MGVVFLLQQDASCGSLPPPGQTNNVGPKNNDERFEGPCRWPLPAGACSPLIVAVRQRLATDRGGCPQ